jgi:hypothetical protein
VPAKIKVFDDCETLFLVGRRSVPVRSTSGSPC